MKNLFIPLIVSHALAVRIAVMFPVFQIFIAVLLIGEFLLLIVLGGFSRDWANQERFALACGIFGFLVALVVGV